MQPDGHISYDYTLYKSINILNGPERPQTLFPTHSFKIPTVVASKTSQTIARVASNNFPKPSFKTAFNDSAGYRSTTSSKYQPVKNTNYPESIQTSFPSNCFKELLAMVTGSHSKTFDTITPSTFARPQNRIALNNVEKNYRVGTYSNTNIKYQPVIRKKIHKESQTSIPINFLKEPVTTIKYRTPVCEGFQTSNDGSKQTHPTANCFGDSERLVNFQIDWEGIMSDKGKCEEE